MSPVITTPAPLGSGIGNLRVTDHGYPTRRTAAELRGDDRCGVGGRGSDQRGGARQLIQAIGIAEKIVDVVDLPCAGGDSTGSLASQAMGVAGPGPPGRWRRGHLVRQWPALQGCTPGDARQRPAEGRSVRASSGRCRDPVRGHGLDMAVVIVLGSVVYVAVGGV
jgi:hypothetical protein